MQLAERDAAARLLQETLAAAAQKRAAAARDKAAAAAAQVAREQQRVARQEFLLHNLEQAQELSQPPPLEHVSGQYFSLPDSQGGSLHLHGVVTGVVERAPGSNRAPELHVRITVDGESADEEAIFPYKMDGIVWLDFNNRMLAGVAAAGQGGNGEQEEEEEEEEEPQQQEEGQDEDDEEGLAKGDAVVDTTQDQRARLIAAAEAQTTARDGYGNEGDNGAGAVLGASLPDSEPDTTVGQVSKPALLDCVGYFVHIDVAEEEGVDEEEEDLGPLVGLVVGFKSDAAGGKVQFQCFDDGELQEDVLSLPYKALTKWYRTLAAAEADAEGVFM